MYEVEVKVRADHAAIREKLAAANAERTDAVTQTDVYYDAPDRDFAETDESLRIRREASPNDGHVDSRVTRLTYKGPLVEAASKTRVEHETGVADANATGEILRGLGFEPAATVEKERERFLFDGYTVTLDTVTDLGEFVEVEAESPGDDVEAVREGAFDVLRRLDMDPSDQILTSYLGLLLAPDGDSSQ